MASGKHFELHFQLEVLGRPRRDEGMIVVPNWRSFWSVKIAAVPDVCTLSTQCSRQLDSLEVPATDHSTALCRQISLPTLALFAVPCGDASWSRRRSSRYADWQLGLQYFSFNPCVDPDRNLAPVITLALKRINHRCVPHGPVDARSDVIQTSLCNCHGRIAPDFVLYS
jgi:hypothetical protein